MVTKKGTPVKKTKDVKIAANVMADSIKTEEKAKAEVKTEIKPQTKEKVEAEAKTEIKPQTKEKVEAKVEKAAADTVEKITRKAVKGAGATKTVKKAAKKDIIIKAFVEYYGKQVEEKDIIARVKKAWTRSGKKVGDIKEMDLYIKPEENAVYYVINGTETGAVEFE
jgi:hypothetical protein